MFDSSMRFGKSSLLQENDECVLHFVITVYNLMDTMSKRVSIGCFINMVVCHEGKRLGVMNEDVAKPFYSVICLVYYFERG